MKKCVFAGTFDPPTVGHEKIIKTCLKIFDKVTVAVMLNPAKTPYFTEEERVNLLKLLYKEEKRVKIITFGGAAVDLLKQENTPFYVRGVRNTVDFEYENTDFFASRKLDGDMVTLYVPSEQEDIHVSSSIVKNHIKFAKDYLCYIPEKIRDAVAEQVNKKREEENVRKTS